MLVFPIFTAVFSLPSHKDLKGQTKRSSLSPDSLSIPKASSLEKIIRFSFAHSLEAPMFLGASICPTLQLRPTHPQHYSFIILVTNNYYFYSTYSPIMLPPGDSALPCLTDEKWKRHWETGIRVTSCRHRTETCTLLESTLMMLLPRQSSGAMW